jgi:hypothetical protein
MFWVHSRKARVNLILTPSNHYRIRADSKIFVLGQEQPNFKRLITDLPF